MSASRNKQLYIGLILALVAAGFVLDRFDYLGPVRAVVQTLLTPLQSEISTSARELSGYIETTADIRALQEKNKELETWSTT
jgi:cell shape-determining protein MreC